MDANSECSHGALTHDDELFIEQLHISQLMVEFVVSYECECLCRQVVVDLGNHMAVDVFEHNQDGLVLDLQTLVLACDVGNVE